MALKPYDMIRATLTCSECGKTASVLLMVTLQGIIKTNTYICSDDFALMSMEIRYDETTEVDSGSDKSVQGNSET
jgi:hypothetical protein